MSKEPWPKRKQNVIDAMATQSKKHEQACCWANKLNRSDHSAKPVRSCWISSSTCLKVVFCNCTRSLRVQPKLTNPHCFQEENNDCLFMLERYSCALSILVWLTCFQAGAVAKTNNTNTMYSPKNKMRRPASALNLRSAEEKIWTRSRSTGGTELDIRPDISVSPWRARNLGKEQIETVLAQ